MFVVSVLLFWAPVLGPIVAGFAGGEKAEGVGGAIMATLLPGIALGIGLFLLVSTLSGMSVVGAVAGMGGATLALAHVGPMLLGAVVGGAIAQPRLSDGHAGQSALELPPTVRFSCTFDRDLAGCTRLSCPRDRQCSASPASA
jgi:hypothetical protein